MNTLFYRRCWSLPGFSKSGAWLLGLGLLLGACADEKGGVDDKGGNPIVGNYTDQFNGTHQITNDTWTRASSFGTTVHQIEMVGHDRQFLITSRTHTVSPPFSTTCPGNFNPSATNPVTCFARDHWEFDVSGELYYCTAEYQQFTRQDALSIEDTPTLAATLNVAGNRVGCGNFEWTHLTPR